MSKPVKIRDFGGLGTNVDTLDAKKTLMQRQKNLTCHRAGELKTRAGLRRVKFT